MKENLENISKMELLISCVTCLISGEESTWSASGDCDALVRIIVKSLCLVCTCTVEVSYAVSDSHI